MTLLTVVWGVCFLITGKVPIFNQIKVDYFALNRILTLPFGIARWWDVPAIVIWIVAYLLIWRNWESVDKDERQAFILFNVILVILGLLLIGLQPYDGYIIPLFIWVVVIIVATIIIEFSFWSSKWHEAFEKDSREDLVKNILFNLSLSMSVGFTMIVSSGLVPGLIVAILNFFLITLIQFVIKLLRSVGTPARAFGRWLTVKGK